jgi:hypothetical protein
MGIPAIADSPQPVSGAGFAIPLRSKLSREFTDLSVLREVQPHV